MCTGCSEKNETICFTRTGKANNFKDGKKPTSCSLHYAEFWEYNFGGEECFVCSQKSFSFYGLLLNSCVENQTEFWCFQRPSHRDTVCWTYWNLYDRFVQGHLLSIYNLWYMQKNRLFGISEVKYIRYNVEFSTKFT